MLTHRARRARRNVTFPHVIRVSYTFKTYP